MIEWTRAGARDLRFQILWWVAAVSAFVSFVAAMVAVVIR